MKSFQTKPAANPWKGSSNNNANTTAGTTAPATGTSAFAGNTWNKSGTTGNKFTTATTTGAIASSADAWETIPTQTGSFGFGNAAGAGSWSTAAGGRSSFGAKTGGTSGTYGAGTGGTAGTYGAGRTGFGGSSFTTAVAKVKPPISTVGCMFEATKKPDKTSSNQLQNFKIAHICMIPYFKRYTVEEIRYYDYVQFNKLPPWAGATTTSFSGASGSFGTQGGFNQQPKQVIPQQVSPWSCAVDNLLKLKEKLVGEIPEITQKQPYGALKATEIKSDIKSTDSKVISPALLAPKLKGFSRTANQFEENSNKKSTPGIQDILKPQNYRSEKHKGDQTTTMQSRHASSSATIVPGNPNLIPIEALYQAPEIYSTQNNQVSVNSAISAPTHSIRAFILFPLPIDDGLKKNSTSIQFDEPNSKITFSVNHGTGGIEALQTPTIIILSQFIITKATYNTFKDKSGISLISNKNKDKDNDVKILVKSLDYYPIEIIFNRNSIERVTFSH